MAITSDRLEAGITWWPNTARGLQIYSFLTPRPLINELVIWEVIGLMVSPVFVPTR